MKDLEAAVLADGGPPCSGNGERQLRDSSLRSKYRGGYMHDKALCAGHMHDNGLHGQAGMRLQPAPWGDSFLRHPEGLQELDVGRVQALCLIAMLLNDVAGVSRVGDVVEKLRLVG